MDVADLIRAAANRFLDAAQEAAQLAAENVALEAAQVAALAAAHDAARDAAQDAAQDAAPEAAYGADRRPSPPRRSARVAERRQREENAASNARARLRRRT